MAEGNAPAPGPAADLLDDIRSFARRKPGAFLLGAAVAGIVAGRMFRGAKDASTSTPSTQGIDTPQAPALGTIEASALPAGSPSTDQFQGDPLMAGTTTGREALGERVPTTGPLSTYNTGGLA